MANIRIPTPLRPYAGDNEYVTVTGATVGEALGDLVEQHPDLGKHLYKDGELRSFVNIFIGEEDIRFMDGTETEIEGDAELMIIPSIAGGSDAALRKVDHSALRTNQAFIIGLLILAFVLNLWPIVAFVAAVMLIGTVLPQVGLFKLMYKYVFKPLKIVKPDVKIDNPEPHRFAQGFGGAVVAGGALALALALPTVGWALAWLVIVLAAANLFLGFCAGCFMYYQFNRIGVPGFKVAPIKQQ